MQIVAPALMLGVSTVPAKASSECAEIRGSGAGGSQQRSRCWLSNSCRQGLRHKVRQFNKAPPAIFCDPTVGCNCCSKRWFLLFVPQLVHSSACVSDLAFRHCAISSWRIGSCQTVLSVAAGCKVILPTDDGNIRLQTSARLHHCMKTLVI
jgi:hypothetical protein